MPQTSPITLQEAADRLGVHYMTAYRYVRTGRLRAERIGSQWWVDPADLEAAATSAAPPGRRRAGAPSPGLRPAVLRQLEDRLVAGDEAGAWAIVEATLGSGANPDDVLLDALGGAMRSVGAHWASGEYTVDDEHRATGVAVRVVSRLGASFTRRGPKRSTVILGTPPGELHSLPTAMAANLLRGRGYDVADLGADVPVDAFAAAVTKTARPLAVALGVTAGDHDRDLRAIVRAVGRSIPELPVLVGGAAIAGVDHAARVGAGWTGVDARALGDAVDALEGAR